MKYAFDEIIKQLEVYNDNHHITDRDLYGIASDIKKNSSLLKLWRKAENVREFLGLVDETEMKFSDVMINLRNRDWYFRRSYCGAKGEVFKTYSDIGSLKIGNEHFFMLFPNGYGDGMNRVAILPNEEFLDACYAFFPHHLGTMSGQDLKVFEHDCSTEVARQLENGKWWVFQDERFFALVKVNW